MTMKTKPTTNRNQTRDTSNEPELPLRAIHEIADWTLDLARRNANGDREDLAAIERVRRAAHAALDRRKVRAPTERDLLTVASLVVTAAERDFGITGLSDAMATGLDVLSLQSEPMHEITPMPIAPRTWPPVMPLVRHPTLPIRTCAHRGPLMAPFVRCVP